MYLLLIVCYMLCIAPLIQVSFICVLICSSTRRQLATLSSDAFGKLNSYQVQKGWLRKVEGSSYHSYSAPTHPNVNTSRSNVPDTSHLNGGMHAPSATPEDKRATRFQGTLLAETIGRCGSAVLPPHTPFIPRLAFR